MDLWIIKLSIALKWIVQNQQIWNNAYYKYQYAHFST